MKEIWFVSVEKQPDSPLGSYPLINTLVAQDSFFVAKYSHSPEDSPSKLMENDFSSKLGDIDQSSLPIGARVYLSAPALTK